MFLSACYVPELVFDSDCIVSEVKTLDVFLEVNEDSVIGVFSAQWHRCHLGELIWAVMQRVDLGRGVGHYE